MNDDLAIDYIDRFKKGIKTIIEEQDNYTLKLAYLKLCDMLDYNLSGLMPKKEAKDETNQ